MTEERPRWWLKIPLVLIALGGLAFAIYRNVNHKDEKPPAPTSEEPPVAKGKGLKGPPAIPMRP
jgi:hypothetical protein